MRVGDLVLNKLTSNVAFVVEIWGGMFHEGCARLSNDEKAARVYLEVISESR